MSRYSIGTAVRARHVITETGVPPDFHAEFPAESYVHAVTGDLGIVEHVELDSCTVRFIRTGTACRVLDVEVEAP